MAKRMSLWLPLMLLTLAPYAAAGEIVGWRSDGSGRYEKANPPTKWSQDENVLWKAELPGGGYGSPVLVGKRVYVTSEPAELLCFEAATGELLWQRSHGHVDVYGERQGKQIEEEYAQLQRRRDELRRQYNEMRKADPQAKDKLQTQQEKIDDIEQQIKDKKQKHAPPIHRGGAGNAASTPVSDGQHVWAVFGHGVVSCHDLDGKRRWMTFVEGANIGFGHSSSPVLADGNLIVHLDTLVSLDAANGKTRWQKELPARHATPTPLRIDGMHVLLTPSGSLLRAETGEVLAEKICSLPECSAVLRDGVVYLQGNKTCALRVPKTIETEANFNSLWESESSRGRRTPSPVYHDGVLYGINTAGILDVTDAATGEEVYRKRLDLKNVYSSITSAGDYLFISGTRGTTIVLKPGRKYEEVARNELEAFGSCPVFVGRRMYVRARKHLYCIGE